jgi:hypothetical protein
MKTNPIPNQLFLNYFGVLARRIRWPSLALTMCLLGFLLPARGEDPWLTNTNNPIDTNVSLGATVSFRVYASSANLPLTYQWQHNATNVPGATLQGLVLTNVSMADAGGYVAWITNAIGGFTNSRTATLTVDPTYTQIMTGILVTDTVGAWNASWIDYDGDGYLDVSVAPGGNLLARTPLYHNEGDGTFRKVTTNAIGSTFVQAWSHVWGDYDNDGKPDLFVPNWSGMNDMLFHNNGNGSFTRITPGHPVIDGVDSAVGVWGDYDRDGFLDLFVIAEGCPGQNDLLYRNNGDGTFRKMTAAEVGPIVSDAAVNDYTVWADVDNDGWPELCRNIAPACCGGGVSWTNEIWHLDGEGKFYLMDIGEMKKGTGLYTFPSWADYDNDGFLDAVVWAQSGLLSLYRNLAGLGFNNVAASAFPSPLTNAVAFWVGDYDNDGWQDLVVNDWSGAYPSALYRNNGDGTFTREYVGGPTSAVGGYYVPGDYNNDGFLDILVIFSPNTRNLLFRHNGNTNHWLKVKLDGRASNRSGIGAKVRVNATIGGRTFSQMREISGQGPGADNGLLAHFGLGDATNVTTLRIEWPSGIVQELQNVATNQFLTVVESQSYSPANIRPSFTSATKDSSGSQLSFIEPVANARYILEASTDLVNWTKLLARTSAGVTTNYTDTRATNYASRYYRLQVP